MVAADFPAKWLWRINHDFVEAKMFLCTQVMDEARHTEVFRKRAERLAANGRLNGAPRLHRAGRLEPSSRDATAKTRPSQKGKAAAPTMPARHGRGSRVRFETGVICAGCWCW